MDFGSKYVYKYAHSESESVSDDDGDLGNDAEPLFIPRAPPSSSKGAASHRDPQSVVADKSAKRKRLRKADTNVLSVKFNRLLQPSEMHAGDPVYCTECQAIASHLSKIQVEKKEASAEEPSNEAGSKWHCEFCPHVNSVDIEQNDLPKQEDATYLLAPAPVVHGSDMTGIDDSMVFFLIDISGSMSSTTLVQGTFKLPSALKQEERAAEAFGGAHMVRQRQQTYVTRLQGVQMAVAANIDKLVKDAPTKRAALLTFNHEITYYGDGTKDEPLVIRGDKLNSSEDLVREAEREWNNELKPVAETKAKLTDRVYDLEEGGQTALGPAVIFALNIASKRQGSKILICTDGLANRGLGNLETAQDEKADPAVKMQALHDGNQFYAELTERARDKGVSISVITIKGTSCLLPVIGQMADGTGGNVTIVDLLNMRDEFASILEQEVIATNVEATLVVHRGLYIRNPDDPEEKLGTIKRTIGNVTKHTEITFEFGVRNKQEIRDKYHIDLDELDQLPFQVQVTYTAADGNKALRVLTQLKETTADREIAEVNAVRSVIAENHIRSTANDMMVAISDDEDEEDGIHARSKWSTPAVQKQRVAYMDNLNSKVRARRSGGSDQFNERRWNKTSNDLQSQVRSNRSRKAASSTNAAIAAPPAPSGIGSVFGRLSRIVSGSKKAEGSASGAVVPSAPSKKAATRSFGFATRKLGTLSDQNSESLYHYKNMSSDYMRETSPTREEDEPPMETSRFPPRQTEDVGRRPAASRRAPEVQPAQSKSNDRLATIRDVQESLHTSTAHAGSSVRRRTDADHNEAAEATRTTRINFEDDKADAKD